MARADGSGLCKLLSKSLKLVKNWKPNFTKLKGSQFNG